MRKLFWLIAAFAGIFVFPAEIFPTIKSNNYSLIKKKIEFFSSLPANTQKAVNLFQSAFYRIRDYSPQLRQYFYAVDRLIVRSEFRKAIVFLNRLNTRYPNNLAVILYLADLHYLQGNFILSRKYYLQAYKLSEGAKSVSYFAVLTCIKSFDYKTAEDILNRIKDESDPLYWRLKAEMNIEKRSYNKAVQNLERVLSLEKQQNKQVLWRLGLLYKYLKRRSLAEKKFKQLADLGDKKGFVGLVDVYQEEGDLDKAVEVLKNARARFSDSFFSQRLAMLYIIQSKFAAAANILRDLIKQNPQDEASKVLLALAYNDTKISPGNIPIVYRNMLEDIAGRKASSYYYIFVVSTLLQKGIYSDYVNSLIDKIITSNNLDEDLLRVLGMFLVKQKQYSKAKILFNWVLNMDFSSVSTYFFLGVCNYYTDNKNLAEYFFKKTVSLSKNNAEAFNFLADIYLGRRDFKTAKNYVDKAINLDKKNGYFWDTLGWIYYQGKDYQKACQCLEKAMWFLSQKSKDDWAVREHLADAYYALGLKKKAYTEYFRALSIAPEKQRPVIEEKINILVKYSPGLGNPGPKVLLKSRHNGK